MRNGLAELATANVKHRDKDPKAKVGRTLADCLAGNEKRLLEIASPGVLDCLLSKRRNVVHTPAYTR